MDALTNNLIEHYGVCGLISAVLLTAIVTLWRQFVRERRENFEHSVEQTAVLVELNVFLRNRDR